jgi:MFS family permease
MPLPSIEASYRRRWLVLAVLCLSCLLVVVSNMALNVALPTLGRQLQAGTSALAWVVDTYVLCFAGLLLPAGALGDRFGRKGMLQCGLVVFIAAATAGAFATTTWQLILARAVMGIGAALVMPGTLSILATVFPPAERPRAIAIWASVAGGSVAISIMWSGLMLEHFWWGAIFLGMAAVAVVALVAGWRLLPTSRHPDEARLDPLGAVLSVIGVTGLLYGFIQAPDDGWTAAPILAAFAVGIAALAAFIAWERRSAHPMLDVRFFAERRFSLGSLAIAAAYFALFGMYFLSPSTSSWSGATLRSRPACTRCRPASPSSPSPTSPSRSSPGTGSARCSVPGWWRPRSASPSWQPAAPPRPRGRSRSASPCSGSASG